MKTFKQFYESTGIDTLSEQQQWQLVDQMVSILGFTKVDTLEWVRYNSDVEEYALYASKPNVLNWKIDYFYGATEDYFEKTNNHNFVILVVRSIAKTVLEGALVSRPSRGYNSGVITESAVDLVVLHTDNNVQLIQTTVHKIANLFVDYNQQVQQLQQQLDTDDLSDYSGIIGI